MHFVRKLTDCIVQSKSYHNYETLRYSNPEDWNFNRVISDMSVVLRETILTILDSIETGSPLETETARVVSISTTEITEITRFKNTDIQGLDTVKIFFSKRYLNLENDLFPG